MKESICFMWHQRRLAFLKTDILPLPSASTVAAQWQWFSGWNGKSRATAMFQPAIDLGVTVIFGSWLHHISWFFCSECLDMFSTLVQSTFTLLSHYFHITSMRRVLWCFMVWVFLGTNETMRTGILSFTILHAVSTMSDLFDALDYFKEMIAPQEMLIPQRQVDQQRRFEDQLLQTRLRMLTFFNKVGIQLAFLFAVTAVWRLMQHPTYQPCFELIASLIGYVGHVFAEGNVTTSRHFRYVTFTFSCTHFMYSMGVAWETNLVPGSWQHNAMFMPCLCMCCFVFLSCLHLKILPKFRSGVARSDRCFLVLSIVFMGWCCLEMKHLEPSQGCETILLSLVIQFGICPMYESRQFELMVWDMCGICWDLGDSLEIWEYFVMPMFGVSPCQTRWKIGNQTLQVVFLCQEKLCVLFLFLLAVVLIDLKAVLTLYICESAVFTIRFWFLIGFEKLTSIIIVTTLTCHFVVAISLVLIIHNIRSNIAARQNSGSASSLMLGFRHVLRGVCDGDFLLDRSSCSILDDASCLERLLKSKKSLGSAGLGEVTRLGTLQNGMVYDWITENDEISVSLECLWTSCLPRYICEKLVWPSTWLIRARSLSKMRTKGMVGILAWGHFSVSSSTWMHWGLNSEICKYAGVSNSVSKPRISGCGANEMDISGVPDLITPSLYPEKLTFLQEAVWEQLPGPLHGCRKPFEFFEFPKCTRSVWDEHHTTYTTRLEGFTAGSRWSRFFRSLPHQDSQSGLGRRLLLLVSRKKHRFFILF